METLTVKDAATRLGVSTRTIQMWIAAGLFPNAYKLNPTAPNSPYRIPISNVEAFEQTRQN